MDVREIQGRLRQLAEARGWEGYYDPKNLSMSIAAEAGELLEVFQWLTPEEARAAAQSENRVSRARTQVAVMLLQLLRISDALGIDLDDALTERISREEDDLERAASGAPPDERHMSIGEIFAELGLVTPEELARALDAHESEGKLLGRTLIDLGVVTEKDLVRALARQVGAEFVDLAVFPIDPFTVSLIPADLARRHRAVAIGERNGKLLVAMSDVSDTVALHDIAEATHREIQPVIATSGDILRTLRGR
jgi:NTP pyrophosphatase (non-canonical NTP hydrolase)